tara:strand:- start:3418 stop:4383 length:966 start_codon:yes stop_codon:yes gene_type:complete
MASLLILAYNEDKTIKSLLDNLYEHFDKIILLDDNSSDFTYTKCEEYINKENFIYYKNKKNLGAGKSFEVGINIFNKLDSEYLVKIDGDNQFSIEDIKYLSKKGQDEGFDFIKCDRFWENGIKGKIPFVRYLGNALASLLIKLTTGNWKVNDPLNGLFFISKKITSNFTVRNLFKRYGYPFYLIYYVINFSKENKLKIGQYQNIVKYGDEKSQLKANTMFFKLLYFTFVSYCKKIKKKLKYSNLQFSALIDIISQLFLFLSFYSVIRIVMISESAPKGSWLLMSLMSLFISIILLFISQNIENDIESNNIVKIKNYEFNKK